MRSQNKRIEAYLLVVIGFVTFIITVTAAVTAVVRKGILDLMKQTSFFILVVFLLLL